MTIAFSKKENKQHTLTCTRTDGSQTWMQVSDFFVAHDLMHYATETVLQYKDAFYGMLNRAINITDFEKPKSQRTVVLSEQAIIAEHLVNLLLIEHNQGLVADFNETLLLSFAADNPEIKPPVVSEETHKKIHNIFSEQINKWYKLATGQTLVLNFNNN